jgi:peptidoglycan hydrolase-like protein with peptidoglycan-binding domain
MGWDIQTNKENAMSDTSILSKRIRQTAQRLYQSKLSRRRPAHNEPDSVSRQDDPIGTAKVTASAINVRKGPGTNYERIGGLSKGKSVPVYEDTGEWLKIAYGTQEGYICQKYTDFKDQADTTVPEGATYTGTESVKVGSTNKEAIKTLQLYLNKHLKSEGVSELTADGSFGDMTWTHLMYFQYTRNLCDSSGRIQVDGVCGPKTWEALRNGAPVVYHMKDAIPFADGKRLTSECSQKLSCGGAMCPAAAAEFEDLIVHAKKDKHTIKVTSSFRGMTTAGTSNALGSNKAGQIELFVDWKGNTEKAATPGYSKHQSGRAVDINLDNDSTLFDWLVAHAGEHGFENYPKEAWHWNYVKS